MEADRPSMGTEDVALLLITIFVVAPEGKYLTFLRLYVSFFLFFSDLWGSCLFNVVLVSFATDGCL
jgi:hypothetical protein